MRYFRLHQRLVLEQQYLTVRLSCIGIKLVKPSILHPRPSLITLQNIKQKMYEVDGYLPPDAQLLYYAGNVLENGRTLADYNIGREDILTSVGVCGLFVVSTGLLTPSGVISNGTDLFVSANKELYGRELFSVGIPGAVPALVAGDISPGAGSSDPNSIFKLTDTTFLFSATETDAASSTLWVAMTAEGLSCK